MSDFALIIKVSNQGASNSKQIINKAKEILDENGFFEFLRYGKIDKLIDCTGFHALILIEADFEDTEMETGTPLEDEVKDMFFEDAETVAELLHKEFPLFEFKAEMIYW